MPTIEVDETEVRRHHQLANVISTIMSHPKAKLLAQQAHRMVDPNARTPELDQIQVVHAPIAELRKDFATLANSIKQQADARAQSDRLAALQSTHTAGITQLRRDGWTDDGIKGVEKMMEEKGLLDPLDAAAIYEKAHPPQAPAVPSGSGAWNFAEGVTDDQSDIKRLLDSKGQNDLVVEKMASGILNEVRQASRR